MNYLIQMNFNLFLLPYKKNIKLTNLLLKLFVMIFLLIILNLSLFL